MAVKINSTIVFPGSGYEELKQNYNLIISKDCSKDSFFLITMVSDNIDREFLVQNRHLLGIANFATGVNNIDVDFATELGIPITNTPSAIVDCTAEHTFALILSLARKIPQAHFYVIDGKFKRWDPSFFLGSDIIGKTLGIIGYGKVGKKVAKIAKAFGMRIIVFNRSLPKKEGDTLIAKNIEQLLKESDFVTLHVPLTQETKHLINLNNLKLMKKTAYIINTSRGAVIKEEDLVWALKNNIISGAALDVFEFEPKVNTWLLKLKNVVLTPHIGTATKETRDLMSKTVAENIITLTKGEKCNNTVNPKVYETDAYKKKRKEYLKSIMNRLHLI